jgi:hypothetical protein
MTPHETKAQELARQIIRLHEYLSGAVKPSEKTITERILRHFPEPQNEYNCPPVCAKCNQQPTTMTTETPRTDAFHHPTIARTLEETKSFARKLERELNELRKDKERLDWLEKCYDWQFRPTPTSIFYCHEFRESLRTAIDQARNK